MWLQESLLEIEIFRVQIVFAFCDAGRAGWVFPPE